MKRFTLSSKITWTKKVHQHRIYDTNEQNIVGPAMLLYFVQFAYFACLAKIIIPLSVLR